MSQKATVSSTYKVRKKGNLYRVIRRLTRKNVSRLSAFILLAAIICAFFPGWIAPRDPFEQDISKRLRPPLGFEGYVPGYYLGTDQVGRDILSRIIFATRISLLVSVSAVLVSSVIGVSAGVLAGYYGGRFDLLVMRLIDILLAFPIILLVISVVAVVGPSLINLILIMGLSNWARYARIVRGSVLSIKEMEYVDAAYSIGASELRVMLRHILPNALSPLIILASFEMARMILLEAAISFLGLGVQPPNPTWGGMINDGRPHIYASWAISMFPGLAIVLIIFAFNMLGDEIRDALDPEISEYL